LILSVLLDCSVSVSWVIDLKDIFIYHTTLVLLSAVLYIQFSVASSIVNRLSRYQDVGIGIGHFDFSLTFANPWVSAH